jgi:aspartate racemase
MRTIGLLGGMSWESTIPYYRIINQTVKEKLGGLHSAKIVLHSVDFAEVAALQHAGDWDGAAALLVHAAQGLRAAGAESIIICTNTMHKVADQVERAAGIPLLHVADVVSDEILRRGLKKVGLLGTRFTMEQDFYRNRLWANGIEAIVPNETDRNTIHRVIYEELCQGIVRDESRVAYREIIQGLIDEGVEGIILGCTEIAMLIGPQDCTVPTFDTTEIHARAAAMCALRAELADEPLGS